MRSPIPPFASLPLNASLDIIKRSLFIFLYICLRLFRSFASLRQSLWTAIKEVTYSWIATLSILSTSSNVTTILSLLAEGIFFPIKSALIGSSRCPRSTNTAI